jgi:hypothetical protein
LAEIAAQPSSELSFHWVMTDPDLEALRHEPTFKAWKARFTAPGESGGDEGAEKELKALLNAWNALSEGAKQHAETWRQRHEKPRLSEIQAWARGERDIWSALVHWARKPEDEERRDEFRTGPFKESKIPADVETKKTLGAHRELWKKVSKFASELGTVWSGEKDEAEDTLLVRRAKLALDDVAEWADHAYRTWQALSRWADDATDENAQKDFESCVETYRIWLRLIALLTR